MKQTKYESVESVLKNNAKEIIVNLMNDLMLNDCHLIKYAIRKELTHLTLKQLCDKQWTDARSKSEFGTRLSVEFGGLLELYLPHELEKFGCNAISKFTSKGDMLEDGNIHWEIKTGRGKEIQGSTHSPKEKESMYLIQVLWNCDMDKPLDEMIKDGKFISKINISVFKDIMLNSKGKHTNQNSRTSLRFISNMYDECVKACVYGSVKKNPTWVKFVKESV
jgi:hypothetical protein